MDNANMANTNKGSNTSYLQITVKYILYTLNIIVIALIGIPALSIQIPIWWIDNLLSLQLQWSIIAILLICINFKYSVPIGKKLAVLYAIIIVYNHQLLFTPTKAQLQADELLNIAQLNVRYNNPEIETLITNLSNENYDVIVLQEISHRQRHKFDSLTQNYPYSIGAKEDYPSGMALFSKWPIVNKKVHYMSHRKGHIIEAVIQSPISDTPVQIYTLHPTSPRTQKLWQLRNTTLNYVAEKASASFLQYKIIIGDLNTSPWSTKFKQVERISTLGNTASKYGYIPSWSVNSSNYLMRILSSAYIDHCFISDSFNVINKEYSVVEGSDHVLIVTTLGLK